MCPKKETGPQHFAVDVNGSMKQRMNNGWQQFIVDFPINSMVIFHSYVNDNYGGLDFPIKNGDFP